MDREEYLEEKYKERLKKIIGKKFDTTMIYPLSQFEKVFGSLWGHGKPVDAMTDQEKHNFDMWQECRTNILNNGNHQKRNAFAEIDMHRVIWKRYSYTLVPVDRKEPQVFNPDTGVDGNE